MVGIEGDFFLNTKKLVKRKKRLRIMDVAELLRTNVSEIVTRGQIEMMKVCVDGIVTLVARHGLCSLVMVTVFFMSRNIICCVWEMGNDVFEKKGHFLCSLGEKEEGELDISSTGMVSGS